MVNPAVDFFGGIGLGALVGPGGNLLWGMVGKGFNFETWRTNLDSMINSLLPLIKEMEDQNKALVIGDDEIEDLKQKLTEGEDLVEELKKVSSWSLMTPLHTNRLAELDKSIKRLLEILKVQGIRDVKGISLLAKDHTKQLKACKTDVEGTLVLAKDHAEQLKACKRDVEETLVLARDHSDQLTDCKSHVEDTLGLARDHSDQLTDCKSHVEDTLGLARKIDAKLDKFERIGLVQGDEGQCFQRHAFASRRGAGRSEAAGNRLSWSAVSRVAHLAQARREEALQGAARRSEAALDLDNSEPEEIADESAKWLRGRRVACFVFRVK
ncbi:hypothetical protein L3X38_039084 [Prunus dulcis]|uniref:RPW8 domain-containing protein n=1 Tax=Prunus dulcis TaxID=3755 RepID=A0AAD4V7P9_PRUDU|nr:hypothetical protein L3X38_039084 [Prunus dulcis]